MHSLKEKNALPLPLLSLSLSPSRLKGAFGFPFSVEIDEWEEKTYCKIDLLIVTCVCCLGVSPVLHFIGLTVNRLNQMTYIFILPEDFYSSSNREVTSPLLFPLRLSKMKGLAESLFLKEYLVLKVISACLLYISLKYLGLVSYENFMRWFQKDLNSFPGCLWSWANNRSNNNTSGGLSVD